MIDVSPQDQIAFVNNIQRLLSEGQFSATYKFALLLALADICVEKGREDGDAHEVSTTAIAEKFILYYWRQIRPFASGAGKPFLLRQNTDRHPAIIRELRELHARGAHSLVDLQHEMKTWTGLVGRVRKTICEMPLGKLQTLGTSSDAFLYDDSAAKAGRIVETITLRPGVSFCLRKFHPLITDLVRGAWVRYVRRYNADALGAPTDLDEFLFGSERAPLQVYVPILRELQQAQCFYCGREMIGAQAHVDHFIPWARYPVDLGHNFVLAHATCNSAKADHLAAVSHLEKWVHRNETSGGDLANSFDRTRILHNAEASKRIAHWAYQSSGERSMSWIERATFEELPSNWQSLFAA